MDMSSSLWLSEMEMDDLKWTDEYEVSREFLTATFVNEGLHQVLSSKSYSSSPPLALTNNSSTSCASRELERPLKPNCTSSTTQYHESSPLAPSFSHIDPSSLHQSNRNLQGAKNKDCNVGHLSCTNEEEIVGQGTKKRTSSITKPENRLRNNVITERMRRENLNKLFMALSAVLPSLKKMDKSSILEEAIKYIKQLQEEEKKFEVLSRERAAESRVIMKKAEIFEVGDEISDDTMEDSLPEVEVRVCGKNVLIRIHCQKQKGALTKALTELEKLNVTVINSIALPFGDLTLDITIIAQMEKECGIEVKDLVRSLRSAF